jgi:N-acyl-phosphatidylethanolamine-hydrolysing phospholipase D
VRAPFALGLAALLSACTASRILGGNLAALGTPPRPVQNKITHPARSDARIAVTWVGHATVLLQMDDKFILTDPVFTETIGQITRRAVEPGLDPENLPPIDAVLVSHMHFDHLSLGSLDMIESKTRRLFVPKGGLVYIPNYPFDERELATWARWEEGGLAITAVPVKHNGFRYGLDGAWMTTSYTGYVVEYHGLTVYFGGDTAYFRGFAETRLRFPHIDLALLPIAPIHPRSFMEAMHVDPREALQAMSDLGARAMMPIHFDTFPNSADEPGEARDLLRRLAGERGWGPEKVAVLDIGEQRVIVPLP